MADLGFRVVDLYFVDCIDIFARQNTIGNQSFVDGFDVLRDFVESSFARDKIIAFNSGLNSRRYVSVDRLRNCSDFPDVSRLIALAFISTHLCCCALSISLLHGNWLRCLLQRCQLYLEIAKRFDLFLAMVLCRNLCHVALYGADLFLNDVDSGLRVCVYFWCAGKNRAALGHGRERLLLVGLPGTRDCFWCHLLQWLNWLTSICRFRRWRNRINLAALHTGKLGSQPCALLFGNLSGVHALLRLAPAP